MKLQQKKKAFESSYTKSRKKIIYHQNHLLSHFCTSRWAALSSVVVLKQYQIKHMMHFSNVVSKQQQMRHLMNHIVVLKQQCCSVTVSDDKSFSQHKRKNQIYENTIKMIVACTGLCIAAGTTFGQGRIWNTSFDKQQQVNHKFSRGSWKRPILSFQRSRWCGSEGHAGPQAGQYPRHPF